VDRWLNQIIEGDCLEVMKKLPDKSIDMILCDLPYGTTQNKWDSIIPLDKLWEHYDRIIKDNGCIALFAQTPFDKVLGSSNLKLLKYEWIWEKNKATGFLNSKKMPLKAHENVLIFYKSLPVYSPQGLVKKTKPTINKGNRGKKEQGAGGTNYGKATKDSAQKYENYPRDVLQFGVVMKPTHPTEKPVDLCEYFIRTYTDEGDLVLDNCIGSGTTAIAALNTGRFFIGIEKEPKYVEIARKRVEQAQAQQSLFA
jgi:site-specific DNA-methyltransferase (adenine-specific)